MGDVARRLLLLAGRLASSEVERLRALAGRLERQGFLTEILCVSAADGHATGRGVIEKAGLGSRWQRFWTVRSLTSGGDLARPDVIHVVDSGMAEAGLAVAERWHVPYVLTIDEYLPRGGRLRLSRRWCRGLVATAPELADDLVGQAGAPRRALSVVRPGLVRSEEPWTPAAPETARVPVIGTAGRLASGSGLATFLVAARRLVDLDVDAEFVIAGQGPSEPALRRMAEQLKVVDRVTFADAAESPTFWKVLDVFCHTALSPTVGWSLALALSFGIPSITTDVEGLGAWFTHETTGLVVPAGDADALARAIRSLLTNPEHARELGHRGQKHIAQMCDPDREAAELANVYRQALASQEGLVPRLRTDRPAPRPCPSR